VHVIIAALLRHFQKLRRGFLALIDVGLDQVHHLAAAALRLKHAYESDEHPEDGKHQPPIAGKEFFERHHLRSSFSRAWRMIRLWWSWSRTMPSIAITIPNTGNMSHQKSRNNSTVI